MWEGPHINQRVQVRRLTSKQKGSNETKWERPQKGETASESAHKQVGRPTIKCKMRKYKHHYQIRKSFQTLKLQPQYTPPTTVKTRRNSSVHSGGQQLLLRHQLNAIECSLAVASALPRTAQRRFSSDSMSPARTTPPAQSIHMINMKHWNYRESITREHTHQITRITDSSEDWENSNGCSNVHTTVPRPNHNTHLHHK